MEHAKRVVRSALIVGVLGLSFNLTAPAQEMPDKKSPVSDQDLKAFAKAYIEIDKIRLAYAPSLENARDAEQAQTIQREAVAEMEKAVEEQGLTGERYVRIFNTVKDDVELRGKTVELIEQEQRSQ